MELACFRQYTLFSLDEEEGSVYVLFSTYNPKIRTVKQRKILVNLSQDVRQQN